MEKKTTQSEQEFVIDAYGVLTAYKGNARDIVLPSAVKVIGERVFSAGDGYKYVRNIMVPEGVTEIREFAFYQSHITDVTLPSTLKMIGKGAFQGCRKLRSIAIPDGVTEIAEHAFMDSNLTEIRLPGSLARIGRKAFCRSCLKEIHLSAENTVVIGREAFWECHDLEKIDLTVKGSLMVNRDAFYECDHLEKIDLSVTGFLTIGRYAFYECSCLEKIDLSEADDLEIGRQAFAWCESLKEITFPKRPVKIGKEAFSMCRDLKSITIPDGVTRIHERAFKNSSLEEIHLPQSIAEIGDEAFMGCSDLKKIDLPETNKLHIGWKVFAGCTGLVDENGLFIVKNTLCVFHRENMDPAVQVDLPDNVTYIDKGVFDQCGPVHITMPLECPSWPVLNVPRFTSSILKCNGSSISFRNTDGKIVAKVVLPKLNEPVNVINQFAGTVRPGKRRGFDFEAYDSNFIRLKDTEGKTRMALVRLRYPYELSEIMQKAYADCLRKNGSCAGKIVIDDTDMDMFRFLLDRKELDPETVAELIGYAQEQEKYEYVSHLLDYQNREFGIEERLGYLELPEDEE